MAHHCTWDDSALEALESFAEKSSVFLDWKLRKENAPWLSSSEEPVTLRFSQGLFQADLGTSISLRMDLVNDKRNYQRRNTQGKKDLLLRAIGFASPEYSVIDLTCGLGRDTVFLAQQGCKVVAYEKDPLIAFLFQSSLELQKPDCIKNISFSFEDSAQCENFPPSDAIYFDPMYPETKQTALPRKEVQFLRMHLGPVEKMEKEEHFIANLLRTSRASRVVLKKHPLFRFLPDQVPDHVFKGETVSYNAYFRKVLT